MKRVISSLLLTVLITLTGVNAQNNSPRTNGNARSIPPVSLTLPNKSSGVRFLVMGDTGTGSDKQQQLAQLMVRYRHTFPFEFVLMLGDNMYGGEKAVDYKSKFENVYRPLIDQKVKFYAALGNHDDPRQVDYPPFHMKGRRYYSFAAPGNLLAGVTTPVELFALDSTNLDRTQLRWLDQRLAASRADWKICFLHYPLYTSGRYRMAAFVQRASLEPLFVTHGVNVVFSGHEHIYQRSTLVGGVQYFVSGGAGSLRPGDGARTSYIARTYSGDYHFMLVEIEGDLLHFQAISRTGRTIDAGTLSRVGHRPPAAPITALGMVGRR